MSRKIIATGLTGLVGTRISELLGQQFTFLNFSKDRGVDITDYEGLRSRMKASEAETVVHLAAIADVDMCEKEKGNLAGVVYRTNVIGTRYIAQLCNEFGKNLIYISTDFVFDGKKKEPYTEVDSPNPINWYGETKFLGEMEVKKFHASPCILRLARPFRSKFLQKSDIVRSIIEGLSKKDLMPMFDDQKITPTLIDDFAQVLSVILNKKLTGIYNTVGSTIISPYEAAMEIANVFGFDTSLVKKGSLSEFLATGGKTPRPMYVGLSNKKISDMTGVHFNNFHDGLLVIKRQQESIFR